MKIAVMSAMHEENASIVNDMHIESKETIGSRTYLTGHLCDKNVVVVFSQTYSLGIVKRYLRNL